MKLLFIAWDAGGAHYMSGLFLPILQRLVPYGYQVEVLHLSSIVPEKVKGLKLQAEEFQIAYHHISIDRSPKGFVYAIRLGRKFLRDFQKQNPGAILMPRSYMPALMLRLAGLKNCTLVYDMDGLSLDERLDFAGWSPISLKYKFFRAIEKWIFKRSKAIMVRTNESRRIICERHPHLNEGQIFRVVNGKDISVFNAIPDEKRQEMRTSLGVLKEEVLVVYCGTIAPQYCLDEMFHWFNKLLAQGVKARFMLLTGQVDIVKAHDQYQVFEDQIILKTVQAKEVPRYLGASDVALGFRRAKFSMKGVAPIKIGEYLLCGLPVICSKGIGDTEKDLQDLGSVIVIDECNTNELNQAVVAFVKAKDRFLKVPVNESVEMGRDLYSLEAAESSYMRVLEYVK